MENWGDPFKKAERKLRKSVSSNGFTVVRVDGKAFHSYTRAMARPFSAALAAIMQETARSMCNSDMPVIFAYTQSDEISLLMDNRGERTQPWFGGDVQKIASVSASYATAYFNKGINLHEVAAFDGRVFNLKNPDEVWNYFMWRKADANRNAISMLAQSMFSHKELHGKSKNDMLDMIEAEKPESLPIASRFYNGAHVWKKPATLTERASWTVGTTDMLDTLEGIL